MANIARAGCAFAGSGEADNKTKLNWIIGNAEDDRDFTEPFKKRGGLALGRTGRHTADKADYRRGRLLPARRELPRSNGAAECGRNSPPSMVTVIRPSRARCVNTRIPRHERAVSRRVGWLALSDSGAARHFPAAATSPPPAISDDSATAAATDISSAIVPRLYFRARSRGRGGSDLESPRPRQRFGYGAEGADGRKTLQHRPGW